jgi:hypothetical protein
MINEVARFQPRWIDKFSFVSGAVMDRSCTCIAIVSDELAKQKKDLSLVTEWRTETWSPQPHVFKATTVATIGSPEPDNCFLALGYWGDVLCLQRGKVSLESVSRDPSSSPQVTGPMRGLGTAGKHVYAVGMGRQVYRREQGGVWLRIDEGVRAAPKTGLTGFQTVGGFSEDEVYVAGFSGECWLLRSSGWTQLNSPTNLALNSICCAPDGRAYLCGKVGTIIVGREDTWETIDQDVTKEEFFSVVWFQEKLYLATTKFVYSLESGRLELVDFGESGAASCLHLTTGYGMLWSIGPKDLLAFDGRRWTRIE